VSPRPLKGFRDFSARPLPVANPHINPAFPKLKVNSKNFSKSSRSALTASFENAKAFALDALMYLAENEEEMARFLTETGFDPADLRRMTSDPGFVAAMLDYLCSHESLLVAFGRAHAIDPVAVESARQFLAQHPSHDL